MYFFILKQVESLIVFKSLLWYVLKVDNKFCCLWYTFLDQPSQEVLKTILNYDSSGIEKFQEEGNFFPFAEVFDELSKAKSFCLARDKMQ